MRKNVIITSGLTLAAGIAGAFLRCREMNTVFEPGTGLPIKNAPVSMILIGLSVLVIIAAAVYAFAAGKGISNVKKDDAFNVGSILVLAVVTVCGVIMALGALGNYILDTGEKEIFRIAYLILGAASGVAIIMAALSAYREDSGNYAKLYILPTLFMCLWLVMTYKDNNTNPALVEYSYKCLATAGAAAAFYYEAGYGYGKAAPKRTVAAHIIGAFFCLVALGAAGNIAQAAVFAVTAIVLLVNLCLFVNAPKEPAKAQEAEAEPEAAEEQKTETESE
jgi:hypothetical protein